jgi:hypothetical protein
LIDGTGRCLHIQPQLARRRSVASYPLKEWWLLPKDRFFTRGPDSQPSLLLPERSSQHLYLLA